MSLTYWTPSHDTCTADCGAVFEDDAAARQAGWDRFANGPEPVGYDPSIIPMWTSPDVAEFGVLRLTPTRLRVMPGTLMTGASGELLTWKAGAQPAGSVAERSCEQVSSTGIDMRKFRVYRLCQSFRGAGFPRLQTARETIGHTEWTGGS